MWRNIHPDNAIEAMAVTIRFSAPISNIVGRRVLGDLESAASSEGLIDKQPLQQIMFQLDMANQAAGASQSTAVGMIFQRKIMERGSDDAVRSVLATQLTYQPDAFVIQIYRYRRWAIELKSVLSLLTAALNRAVAAVGISAVRVEYLDRFIYNGSQENARAEGILKPSSMLAGQIFEAETMWHSHTGRFRNVTPEDRNLDQVNADMQILNPPHPLAGNQTLSLMTAVEKQYSGDGKELAPGDAHDFLKTLLEALHTDVVSLFKDVTDSNFAAENGLPA